MNHGKIQDTLIKAFFCLGIVAGLGFVIVVDRLTESDFVQRGSTSGIAVDVLLGISTVLFIYYLIKIEKQ